MEAQLTAKSAGLVHCHGCNKLLVYSSGDPVEPHDGQLVCPRCGAAVQQRKANSLIRTWALLFTALICLIPANLYPIMTVIYEGHGAPSTIFGGVIELAKMNMIPIALIVFIASIAVPFLKLGSLMVLALSVQFKWVKHPRQRTFLYRMVEQIGRWSMLDIFVISILVALVKLGAIFEIKAGPAAPCFVSAVVITIFAAMSFDPRLIWDNMDE